MILGMSQLSVRQDVAVVWLLYYRLFYYVLPFMTGLLLFITHTGVKINRFLDNIPRLFFQKVAHIALVSAVYFAGIMMVLLSTITNLSAISRLFQVLLPFSFNFLDQTVNLLVGFLLLGLARKTFSKSQKGISAYDCFTIFWYFKYNHTYVILAVDIGICLDSVSCVVIQKRILSNKIRLFLGSYNL